MIALLILAILILALAAVLVAICGTAGEAIAWLLTFWIDESS